mgnify:CR=1 FL=1
MWLWHWGGCGTVGYWHFGVVVALWGTGTLGWLWRCEVVGALWGGCGTGVLRLRSPLDLACKVLGMQL